VARTAARRKQSIQEDNIVRRLLIQFVLPTVFISIPPLAAVLVAMVIPSQAMSFFLKNVGEMDVLILTLGSVLFVTQILLGWRALQWRDTGFNPGPDRWVNYLSQAAEWFPMLGLLGTVGGILQTFSAVHAKIEPHQIIQNYAPAITATGCGLYMAFINILPAWIVITGREMIASLGGAKPVASPTGETP
jgi:hypothetical protein